MPVYTDLPTVAYYPDKELFFRRLLEPLGIRSLLDVGAGHGGVFDYGYWSAQPLERKVACDLFWIRPMGFGWETMTGVDVQDLSQFSDGEFDLVMCMETLEHVPDSGKALEELTRVARKAAIMTSADEMHHRGPEQEAIEKVNKHQAYIKQPAVEDFKRLGWEIRVEDLERRQLVGWIIK